VTATPLPLRIGLTGGIASGKSAACARLAGHGVVVVDADVAAREVVAPGQPALAEVVARFGSGVLGADGTLDRGALRARVFADAAERRALEEILHPRVRERMRALADAAHGDYVVLAIPLLAESGADYSWLDAVVVVDVPEAVQLARLVARDGNDEALARAMIAAQAPRAARLALADEVIDNSGSLADLHAAVDALHARLLDRAAARHAASG
jgi:dephospho-CoA kinase